MTSTEIQRLENISQQMAEDIRECANCCDVYSKKKTLYKVLAGKQWEEKLARYASSFAVHKQELQSALTVHTAAGIDKVDAQLSDEARRLAAMNEKYDAVPTN
jgi:hypothetical protein